MGERLFGENEELGFDFVLEGTDLNNSLLSAAIAKGTLVGGKVLHVDSNSVYGGEHASLHPSQFPNCAINNVPVGMDRKFLVDKSPKLLLSKDRPVDALLNADCADFLNFTPVKILFRFSPEEGEFSPVPTSKAAVFADRKFSLVEKRNFMKFVNSVASSLAFNSPDKLIAASDAGTSGNESNWRRYMQSMGLSERQMAMIDLCICLSETSETTEGLRKIRRFLDSLGKFAEGHALLYPNYGTSEILQAFVRKAAVNGAVFALNVGVKHEHGNTVEMTTGDVVRIKHNVIRSPKTEMIDSCLAILDHRGCNSYSGESELRVQGDGSSLLVLGSHSQCCPEGFTIVYGRGRLAEALVTEFAAQPDRTVIFKVADHQAEAALIYDGEEVEKIDRLFENELSLGQFPF